MGVRTAAAKLGFRLAAATSNKKCSCNSLFSIRSIASLAIGPAVVEKKLEKSSNLFLCFDERKELSDKLKLDTNIVFRPIRLDSFDDKKEEELLERATHRFPIYKDVVNPETGSESDADSSDVDSDEEEEKIHREMACQTRITRLGNEILFTVGQTIPRDICSVDPSTHPVEFHVSSQTETKIKSFSTPNGDMRWGVIDGKLYCFDNCGLSQPFEVLDPETDQDWQPLSGPTFLEKSPDKYNVLFLNESRKILGWEDAGNGVYCFDATHPENGWTELVCGFQDASSLIGQNDTQLVIHDNHPELGDFNLMFNYDRYDEPFIISPFFISNKGDSFLSINEPIRLPKVLCSKYRVRYYLKRNIRRKWQPCFDSQFVHLGSRKFCLILHKFKERDYDDDRRTKGKILVATFEYNFIVTSNSTNDPEEPLEIKTRMLGTRCFNYYPKHQSAEKSSMIGAFLF